MEQLCPCLLAMQHNQKRATSECIFELPQGPGSMPPIALFPRVSGACRLSHTEDLRCFDDRKVKHSSKRELAPTTAAHLSN